MISQHLANDMLAAFFRGETLPPVWADTLYFSLLTGEPASGADQTSLEVSYGGYARASGARTSAGFGVSAGRATNSEQIAWPIVQSGSARVTHFGVGAEAQGPGRLGYVFPFLDESNNPVAVNLRTFDQPRLLVGGLKVLLT